MIDILLKFYLNNMMILNILISVFMLTTLIIYVIYKDKINELYFKHKEIINYIIVGALTTLVSIVSYWLIRFIIKNYIVLSILSWIFAVAFAYFTNRACVFESKEKCTVGSFDGFKLVMSSAESIYISYAVEVDGFVFELNFAGDEKEINNRKAEIEKLVESFEIKEKMI